MLALAVVTVIAVWTGSLVAGATLVLGLGAVVRRPAVVSVAAVLAITGAFRADAGWDALAPDRLGPYRGVVAVVAEGRPYATATRVLVEIEGERFESWVRGRAARLRVARWRGGDLVEVSGRREALEDRRAGRVAWEHVVGELELDWIGDRSSGAPLPRASNRIRALIEDGARHLPAADGALLRGLVIGDDRDQSAATIERFRTSGLAHLTAVSGQNVSFVLAAAGPLLRRARPLARWMLTLGLIGWFVALTRFEPSIVRAGAMAALAATAFVLGHERGPARLLALAVIGLVLIDPLLVWSIGFWLSVGATAGVTMVGPWLRARIASLGWLATPVAITLGAQVGVALPSVLVFGNLPLVGTVANLLAVPVAGVVMLYGLPACLLAGAAPVVAPILVAPLRLGVRWIDMVAAIGAQLEPGAPWTWIGWAAIATVVVVVITTGKPGARRRPPGTRMLGDVPAHRQGRDT